MALVNTGTFLVGTAASFNLFESFYLEINADFNYTYQLPQLTTDSYEVLSSTEAIVSGTITNEGEKGILERGICYSTMSNPTLNHFHVPANEGTETGDFSCTLQELQPNTTYYARAYALNNLGVSAYSNNVVSFKTLTDEGGGTGTGTGCYDGVLNGGFAINDQGDRISFSQGNLQYQASTNTWRFAENQWDYVGSQLPSLGDPGGTVLGSDNNEISSTYSGWIDLFGWGTSGYNHGATCYQPWSISDNDYDYFAYGNSCYNMFDQTGKADWGYNAISNGGNTENCGWRTLTAPEWDYLFNVRSTSSGIRYAKAKVNNVSGVILLPDDWQTSYYSLYGPNTYLYTNVITDSQWNALEQHGAVFLPAAGYRFWGVADNVGSVGCYWSASCEDVYAGYVFFNGGGLDACGADYRHFGQSVRLVRIMENCSFTINATPSPAGCGTVSGAGAYMAGAECTLTATASAGYSFVNWTENGEVVSFEPTYSFTVKSNRVLVANFGLQGTLNGLFSVGIGQQVSFSKGNLQYQASTNTWRFAENQWDYVGYANQYISENYDGWIDFFGWGTSGYNHGAICYQPWSSSWSNSNYYAYGNDSYNLFDQTGQADWGYNAISNGGNTENSGWRTLTNDEWVFLCYTRSTSSNILYVLAKVNNVWGVILLPDDWQDSYYSLNTDTDGFSSNIITANQWNTLEQHGAVFLPAAGCRYANGYESLGSIGYYWSASRKDTYKVYCVYFDFDYTWGYYGVFDACYERGREYGQSVRLVRTVEN